MNAISIASNMIQLTANSKSTLLVAVLAFGALCVYRMVTGNDWFAKVLGVVLLVAAVVVLAGCTPGTTEITNGASKINVWHDDRRAVTCWIYSDTMKETDSISCLPDKEIRQ